ncbi:hypothetical protein [Marivivens sp.]|uniref:hypothetical protein n=1 Tax=Marivivens sp. TaxID=1978374 RepID=UPI0025BF7BE4|nr:hypothetical protein [Marivivens sp.]
MGYVRDNFTSAELLQTLPGNIGIGHVRYSTAGNKGQTAANSYKPAILDNGVRITVPPFIGTGEAIIVNTDTMEYSERA